MSLFLPPTGRFDRTDMQQSAMVKDINALGINPYGLHQPGQQQEQQPAAPAPQVKHITPAEAASTC